MKNRIARTLSLTGLRVRVFVALALAGVVTAACDVHGVAGVGSIVSVTVTPNATLAANGTQQMIAEARDADGRLVDGTPTWSVVSGGGTISSTGLFTAGNVTGLFPNTVKATFSDIAGNASITVIAGPLATIVITPNPVTLAVTATQQFIAVGKDASGNNVGMIGTWSVVAGGGTIDQAGIFTAGAQVGTYTNTVQFSSGTLKGFATVNVTVGPLVLITVTPNPATLIGGATQQFVAVGTDVSGNIIPIVPTWSVVALGGIINSAGFFTAGATLGTFTNTVKATSGLVSGFATVIVTVGPLATITITPNPATMVVVTGTTQFTAVGKDVAGNVVAMTPTWAIVTTANGATISQTGFYTAGTVAGTFANKVRATSGTISGFATVIATVGALANITVTPNPVDMPTNSTQQFVAVGTDAGGNIFVISPTWSVVNGGGVISSSGLFSSGGAAGNFPNTVKATSGLTSGFATVTVSSVAPPPSPLASAANFGALSGAALTCGTPGNPGDISGASSVALLGSSNNTYSGFVGIAVIGSCTHDGGVPSAAVIQTAQNDLTAQYTAVKLAPGACALIPVFPVGNNLTGLDLGSIALNNLPPGNYCFSSSAQLTGTLRLSGPATAVWNFTTETSLTTAVGSTMLIVGGGIADNVYWAVGSQATLAGLDFLGNIMAQAAVTLNANTTLHGRALARTAAVDLTAGGAKIIKP